MATQTQNLSLTKPEGNDFVDINALNENMDIIDEALKRLLDSREGWEILSKGINALLLNGHLRIYKDSNNVLLDSATPNTSLMLNTTRASDGKIGRLMLATNDDEISFRPTGSTGTNTMDLGSAALTFKSVWAGSNKRSTEGYTMLPNNFMLIWGKVTLTTTDSWYNFHMSFPSTCLAVIATPYGSGTDARLTYWNKDQLKGYAGTSCVIEYLAIGY